MRNKGKGKRIGKTKIMNNKKEKKNMKPESALKSGTVRTKADKSVYMCVITGSEATFLT